MRFGNLEKGLFLYVSGMMPFWILMYINSIAVFKEGEMIPFWYSIMMLMGVFIQFMGLIWIVAKSRGSRSYVMMDEANPEEVVVIRVTKDGIIIPLFAPKGTYGKAETLCYGENADFMDDGSFPLRTINGNPAIIVYDLLNNALDFRRSIARKHMKRYVENGVDGYKIWKRIKKEKYDVGDDDGKEEKK